MVNLRSGLYDSTNDTTDNYNNTAPAYVTAGGGPANYHGSAWQVHFAVTAAAGGAGAVCGAFRRAGGAGCQPCRHAQRAFRDMELQQFLLRMTQRSAAATPVFINGRHFSFRLSDLSAVGADNEFTFGVSSHADGVMYDALRMEITNTSASPTVTGWDDYTYINGSTQVAQNDAVSIPTLTWTNAGGTGDGMTWDTGTNQNWTTGLVSWTTSANETTFASGANTVFNDSNNGHYNVTLNTTVTPSSVLVNNSSGNYVISGAGKIAGSGGLAKYGTGSLTLNTVNSYTGGTVVNAGTLIVGVSGADTSQQQPHRQWRHRPTRDRHRVFNAVVAEFERQLNARYREQSRHYRLHPWKRSNRVHRRMDSERFLSPVRSGHYQQRHCNGRRGQRI